MNDTRKLKVTTPSDREIAVIRELDAPRRLVFDAWTKPEMIKRWLTGPPGWSLVVCDINLTVGGTYRYVWRGPDGAEMGMGGIYREILPPERLVVTEKFDVPWYPGEALVSLALTEQSGRTTVTITLLYESRDARDGVLSSPMDKGMDASFDQLAQLLSSLPARTDS